MSTRIEDLMIKLSKDPYLAMQFTQNPEVVSGLIADEVNILIRGDREELDRTLHMAKSKTDDPGPKKAIKKPKPKK